MKITIDIYQPAEDSYLLQKAVRSYAEGRVLDLGTGSGIQALTAVKVSAVREVVAVDINEEAVTQLQQKIKQEKLRKISAAVSDIFSNVHSQFNLIIVNPPYLPQDKGVEDKAIYGGKKGWEYIERFFASVSSYLFGDGKILLLFSSLTKKEKVEEIIGRYLFQFQEVEKEKMAFEELYVYLIEKKLLLREVESKGIEQVHYFTHGKRGNIYTGQFNRHTLVKKFFPPGRNTVKVAIKAKREDSAAEGTLEREAQWLKLLNKEGIGPKLLFSGNNYLVYEFVEGEFIEVWISKNNKSAILKVLQRILSQCYRLDQLGITKEELHHPQKHILIDAQEQVTLLDFERATRTDSPQNVTQVIEFFCRMKENLAKKGITLHIPRLRVLAQEYSKNREVIEILKKELVS